MKASASFAIPILMQGALVPCVISSIADTQMELTNQKKSLTEYFDDMQSAIYFMYYCYLCPFAI
jgi:hypothetical protein